MFEIPSQHILAKCTLYGEYHCVKNVRIRSFSGPCFPACGEIGTRKTRNTDTFYAVYMYSPVSYPHTPSKHLPVQTQQ